jgi:hypothetical protein
MGSAHFTAKCKILVARFYSCVGCCIAIVGVSYGRFVSLWDLKKGLKPFG